MNGETLLTLARASIAEAFGGPKPEVPAEPWLAKPGATFVTLTLGGELRGCIGSAQACRPLAEDVADNAKAAAFEDPRFEPMTPEELAAAQIEVSVLTPLEDLPVHDEAELLAKVRPGVDGLVLEWGSRRGLFIPEMWHQLPEPREFVRHLKHKAGLPVEGWLPGTRVHRFTAKAFSEHA